MRRRLEAELVRRGLAATSEDARRIVADGRVTVAGRPAGNPDTLVAADEPVSVGREPREFVSRGGQKLAPALDRFSVDATGSRCLDAGAATGGFTDVLLSRGADHVVAVDVGYGELAWELRNDPRVTVMERTNVRSLRPGDLPYAPNLIVADLSFISLAVVVPVLSDVAAPRADLVLLVKPQFETAMAEVGEGGVVTDPAAWRAAVERVAAACARVGMGIKALAPSSLPGPAGNIEFFVHGRRGQPGHSFDLDAAMAEAEDLRRGVKAR
ncbi:MAG TPA: TlyA family RNA methyltransferase [Actinomycetota bacterium]|nr:TlyA family RNA methyltransferase [Actinomycetota bacterium]